MFEEDGAELNTVPQLRKDPTREAKEILFERQKAYLHTFGEKGAKAPSVIKDLAQFCRADEPCFHADPRIHAVLEGRREVWLRIQSYISLSSDELWTKQTRRNS